MKHTDDISKEGSTGPPAGNYGAAYGGDRRQTPRERLMAEMLAEVQR